MALRDYLAGEVAADYADGFMTRREALRRLGMLGVGLTSASTLLAACSGDDDDSASGNGNGSTTTSKASSDSSSASSGSPSTTTGPPVEATSTTFAGPDGELQGAEAKARSPRGGVLLIHENRGLTPHFFDLAGRFATVGYTAVCVDLLSGEGGTASLDDPAAAPTALAGMSEESLVAMLKAGLDHLSELVPGQQLGVVGFCFGGGMTWNLLVDGDRRISAAVPFYGPAPASPDFSRSIAAVLAIYAGNDTRVNATRDAAVAALEAAGLTHEVKTYEGADHAFFNDTGPRYDPDAANDAWNRTLDWFSTYVG